MTRPALADDETAVICVHNHTSRTIHPLAEAEYETVTGDSARVSVCGKQKIIGGDSTDTEVMWYDISHFQSDGEYLIIDGEVQGKICSHCISRITLP